MATVLSQVPLLAGQDVYVDSTTQLMPLGTYMETNDGRGFRYMKVGAVATVPGMAYQSSALDATNLQPSGGLAVAAAAVGTNVVTITASITLTANQLAGGYMSIDVTPGQGQLYKIKSNTAVSSAANCVVTLEDNIRVALTTASRCILTPNPYNGIVVDPGTATGCCVGVAHTIIAAGDYGWIQTKGVASCLFTGTGVAGKAVGLLTGGTSGSLAPAIAGTQIIGHNIATSITGEYAFVQVTLS